MKRTLIIVLLAAGCSGGWNARATECRALKGSELWHIHAQVAEKEEASLPEYFFGRPEDSVRSLRDLIDTYQRAQCTDLVPPPALESFQYNELLAVGRLARQYARLGNKSQAAAETTRAIDLGRAVLRNPSWSTADLTKLLDEVDKKQRAYLTEVQKPPAWRP